MGGISEGSVEARRYRKALISLTEFVKAFLVLLDAEMSKPSSHERGRRIADLAGKLEMKNDMVRRFTLGTTATKAAKRKAKP